MTKQTKKIAVWEANLMGKDEMDCTKNDMYVSLKEYINVKTYAIEKEITLAKLEMDRRLESMNEIRGTLNDQNNRFITRNEYELAHNKLVDDIRMLREFKATIDGKANMSAVYLSYGFIIINIILTVFLAFYAK